VNLFNPEGKTALKTSTLAAAIIACALSAPLVSAQEKSAVQMQENMKAMQTQMDGIRNTTDPKERQKLMQEHMRAMQENMKAMQGMMGGKEAGMKEGDMMQMMMEQMVQHRQMMESTPAK
jgi:uncharacterized protein HemX